jgi:hypothetical protein
MAYAMSANQLYAFGRSGDEHVVTRSPSSEFGGRRYARREMI